MKNYSLKNIDNKVIIHAEPAPPMTLVWRLELMMTTTTMIIVIRIIITSFFIITIIKVIKRTTIFANIIIILSRHKVYRFLPTWL